VTRTAARALWWVAGAALVLLPLLPVPRWVRARDPGPDWGVHLEAWAIGFVVVVVLAVLAGRMAAQVRVPEPRWPSWGDKALALGGGVLLAAAAAWTSWFAFSGNPHLVDEMAQLFQARIFAAGRLAAPAPESPEFFLFMHTWITPAGWVAQFPPGQSVVLALGMLARAEWLVNPLLGGASVPLIYLVALGLYDRGTARLTAFLWATCAWVLFMSATYMNHVLSVTLLLGTWACVWAPGAVSRWRWVLAGLLLAGAAATRPLDAVAGAVPVLVYLAQRRAWRPALWLALGGLPVMALLGHLNWLLYGAPWKLGYTVLYGAEHSLGFHPDVWGDEYTPLVGLSNVVAAVRRLHIYLFEWAIPALLPLGVWALLSHHTEDGDLTVALALLAGPLLYFFYWHSGFYPGPRFYYVAAPALVLGTARAVLWAWQAARCRNRELVRWDAAVAAALVVLLLWGWVGGVPARFRAYRTGLASLKLHPERELAAAGVTRALVLVPESWGARIVTRLWTLGVNPGLAERAYRSLDACDLHQFGEAARTSGMPASAVTDSLQRMYAAVVEPAPLVAGWPDPTLRLRPGRVLPPECLREMQRDQQGVALYSSLGWRNPIGLADGVVFARDRFDENPVLLEQYPGWDVLRWGPPYGDPEAPPVLARVIVERTP